MSWKNVLKYRNSLRSFFSETSAKVINLDGQKIPGPKHYAILGPINEMLTMGNPEKLHLTIDDYHRRYGPIVHIKLGEANAVFISSADASRSIFLHEGKYPKHIVPPSWQYYNAKHKVERGLLFMDDEEWFKHRQPLNTFLLRDYQWMTSLIQTTCDDFVTRIKRKTNSETPVLIDNLDTELYLWSFFAIINIMLGKSITEQSDSKFNNNVRKLASTFHSIMKSSAKLQSVPPAFADRFNLKIWKDFEHAASETLEISRTLIATLSNEMESSDIGLLKKMKMAKFSDDIIARIFSDLLIAAGDTSVTSTQWFLYKLAKDGELQRRLKKSIDERPLDFESNLVRASLREVLRLYPVATFVGRILDSDAKIGNFIVPKGWLAIISLYTAGRDPENFSEPLKFTPDRWLRESNETDYKVYKPHGTMPFSIGGRSCVGKKIATYQIHCLITKILNNFSLESCNEGEVNLKSELIGIPDKKILISFRNLMS